MKSDLSPLFIDNILSKYADDITMLIVIPQHSTVQILAEFRHIQACAIKLCLNIKRTTDIVLRQA